MKEARAGFPLPGRRWPFTRTRNRREPNGGRKRKILGFLFFQLSFTEIRKSAFILRAVSKTVAIRLNR